MSTAATSPTIPKPPRDFSPLVYWGLFLIIMPSAAILMAIRPVLPQPQLSLPFLNHNVPVYHIITSGDIYMKRVNRSDVKTGTVQKVRDLVAHYTLSAIFANEPIFESRIGPVADQHLISKTLAVAVPANSVTLLGGDLSPGDIVKLASVPLSNTPSLPTIIFDRILVLDIKYTSNQAVIILAIPSARWLYYLGKTRNAILVLARQVD